MLKSEKPDNIDKQANGLVEKWKVKLTNSKRYTALLQKLQQNTQAQNLNKKRAQEPGGLNKIIEEGQNQTKS